MKDRIQEEKDIVKTMIELYCKRNHGSKDRLCTDCEELLNYAHYKLETCRFGALKPTCGRCKIHCYKPEMREKIRIVMKTMGPIMLLHHPLMTLEHARHGLKK